MHKLSNKPNSTFRCYPVYRKALIKQEPGFQFITAFVRSCILLKFTTKFDVIDYTSMFNQLSDPKTDLSFDRLNQLYQSDKLLFK